MKGYMADRLTEILTVHLAVEETSLQALLGEVLDICQHPGGAERAIRRLGECMDSSAAHFDLNKDPWYHIYLAFTCYKQPNLPLSMHWACLAVDGFDQIDHVWNRAIARWFCAMVYQKTGGNEEAFHYFEEAIKLMRREIVDLKRRSFYEKAGQCEKVLVLLLADAGSHPNGGGDHAPSAIIGGQSMDADSLDGLDDLGNFRTPLADLSEKELYQNLLTKVLGDQQRAERLIEYECSHRPGLTRKDYIIRAIEAWERQNR
jgi:tetratricopeptide (TPR) repeat protein